MDLLRAIFVTACILNNMILRFDGLNNLWESDINWTTKNDGGQDVDDVDDDIDVVVAEDPYMPSRYDPAQINTAVLEDLPALEYHSQGTQVEKNFNTLRDYLARHLHLTYVAGKLRWPKVRADCVEKELNLNRLVREYFPGAGDLNFAEEL